MQRGLPPVLEDHFLHPRRAGRAAGAARVGKADNPACGDLLQIELVVRDGRVADAAFLAHGCSSVIAVASLALDRLCGAELGAARAFDLDACVESAGGLPPARRHAVAVVRRALEQAFAAGTDAAP